MGTLTLDKATALAAKVVEELRPACERVEVAGSIRRRRPVVGDIDIVLLPHADGRARLLPHIMEALAGNDGYIDKDGPLAKRVFLRKSRVQVDLWIAQPARTEGGDLFNPGASLPCNWGALMATYTGSKAHNVQGLVMTAREKGWRWSPQAGLIIPGPTEMAAPEIVSVREEEIFHRLFGRWVEPAEREYADKENPTINYPNT